MSKYPVHTDFQLNGMSLKAPALRELAVNFQETGELYEQELGTFILDWLNDKEYVLVNTSGSTGDPKSIKLLKKHMINSAKATAKRFKLDAGTTALHCLPTRFIAGKMMFVRAATLGWKLDVIPPKSNPLDQVFKRYDFSAMTPFQLDNSIARLHLLGKLIIGGGPFSQSLKNHVQDTPTKIYETYGMTETITHIAVRRVNSKKAREEELPFRTLNKVTVSKDDRGCLIIKAPKVTTDPIVTNDLVELISYKKFYWLGRLDNVVNSGGIKLYPESIEKKLAHQIDVPFIVGGEPDEKLGERLILIIECDSFDASRLDFEVLDKYEVPKEIYCIPTFARTPNGKIKRSDILTGLDAGSRI
ncbi:MULTISPECIES: AMP-binding protein [unclassified Leeuwenhoekiella]|uniref:AMP-binding protein n=1 Tax=unclassified Leeuwenhoekiella TaxID=2615029 RepID=UPI000C4B8F4B|nr:MULTISPECIES: AMP-binding protein [unclassified Leeuwenhoekiella]MAW96718.1 O-succinylbenzoic acid--CoA ligase [Leeuwenhoekiella sp.]MBA81607.1 O-succinylbenzoic acid--CoA ligase [Leeuwenhoekiella sp.]|tara:strand:- start:40877 stop:41953 length:1077 start_codon:yes stop_codon:yes gene_type:complete